ncbi:MAG TPA: DNA polymerase I, partial [Candidatus Saccharimonas sp.]|nr:DNA polymerase I [Candidatus Saccharimonas sp.]
GFATMALEIVKKLKPDYVCVAWDKPKTNIRARLKLYPQYKANRKPAPPDFYEQVPILHELLQSLGWPLYELDDYEADDIMGAFAKQADAKGIDTYLVSSDLDLLQAVGPRTHIYMLKKGFSQIELFNETSFREKYGVDAHQWIDTKALKGDSSDNIPGVAGIGEKTALQLISDYKTLDGVYQNLDKLKPAVKAKLEANKDMAYLSKELVTLMCDAPITLDFDAAKLHDGVTPEFVAMLRKLEFRALLRQVEPLVAAAPAAGGQTSLLVPSAEPTAKQIDYNPADFAAGKPRVVAVNPEATELWVSMGDKNFAVISLVEEPSPHDFSILAATLANGFLIGHDLKTVYHAFLALGVDWQAEVGHDTKIAAFILNSLERSRNLSDLLGQTVDPEDPAQAVPAIWQAYAEQKIKLDAALALQKVATQLDYPTINLLAKIEHRGITLDSDNLRTMSEKFAVRIKEFEQKIYELAGQEFNISSPAQLGTILFDKLQLPTQGIKKGKTGYSTGASELDKLRGLHPIADLITQYREYTKLKSTYIDALPKLVDINGKLHTTFNQDVAATGRLSSINPNLQNIPTRTEIGQAIRGAFVPAPGHVFVSADYSQFELRLAAVMADDKELVESFNKDDDVHALTAAQVYDVPLAEVTKDMRRRAKTVNFGILYGMSPHGLSAATDMDFAQAKEFIAKYFELRAPIRTYMERTIKRALIDGYVATIFGRRRPTPDLKSSNFAVREAAKRAAINMPIQGTEADLMKLAMLKAEENLGNLGQQILQIHDSILVETPTKNASQVETILRDTMENIYPELGVKLKVDVKTGRNWGEL